MTLRAVVFAIALALLLAAPIAPAETTRPGGDRTQDLGSPDLSTAVSPGAADLALPWAERAGFSSAELAGTVGRTPTVGPVLVHVTLQPASLALFRPPAPTAAPLSLSEIADRFGRTSAEYGALERYFESEGLAVVHTDPTRLTLSVAGSAPVVGRAFGTSLINGTYGGTPVRVAASAPVLPAPFESEVAAISGLSDGFSKFTLPLSDPAPVVRDRLATARPARTTDQITPTAAQMAYGLSDLYNFSGGTHFATGQSIVLLLWGDGFDPSDIDTFFAQDYPSNFPSVDVKWWPIDQSATPNASALDDPSQAPRELTLDIEWAGSMAPGATLDAVYAPDGPSDHGYSPSDATMEDALTTAIRLANVSAISMSFGTPDGSDPSFQTAFETDFAVATQHGITLLAASGDNGGTPLSGGCPSGGPAPQYPAASPQVLAVGGTAPSLSQTVLGQITGLAGETAWNGSGGGFSVTYGAPGWQSVGSAGSVVASGSPRAIPDVAGPAQYDRFFYGGQPMAGNGTSFATPFWAGLIAEMDALLDRPLGAVAERFYYIAADEENGTKAQGLVDVAGESGPACRAATAGYDLATGWGSPRAAPLFEDLIGTFVDVNLSLAPRPVAPGGAVVATVSVTNASSHRAIAALAVVVTLSASGGYFGPCGGTMATSTVPTNLTGGLSTALTVPGCYFGENAVVDVTILSDGYFGNVSATVPVNLLGWAGFLSFIQYFPYNVIAFGLIMAGATGLGIVLGRWRRRYARRHRPADPPPPPGAPAAPSATGPETGRPSGEDLPAARAVPERPAPMVPAGPAPPGPAPTVPPVDGPVDAPVPAPPPPESFSAMPRSRTP